MSIKCNTPSCLKILNSFKLKKMRAFLLLSTLIVCLRCEIRTICDICDCKQTNVPSFTLDVNCTYRRKILENKYILTKETVSLDLSRNNLTRIQPTPLLTSTTLVELFLNKNSLKEIHPESLQLPNLKKLDLSENELLHLNPYLFKNITKLEHLNLADNKFSAVSQLNFNLLVNLKEIILDNNNLGTDIVSRSLFDINGYGLQKIEYLSLSGMNLRDLHYEYFKTVDNSLKKLIMYNSNVTKIPKLPKKIEYLDVSNNPIKRITLDDFPYQFPLIFLRTLKLNNLEIEELQENVFLPLYLINLELENNKKLKVFSNLTFGRQIMTDTYDFNIANVTLKGGNLTTLDESLYVLFKRVKRLDLQQNPWKCDCRLAWIRYLPINPDLIEDLRCASPSHLYNKRIFDLNIEDFICPKSISERSDEYRISMALGYLLYALLIFVTVSLIYVFIYQPAASVNRQKYYQKNLKL